MRRSAAAKRSCSSSESPRRSISWTLTTSSPKPRATSAVVGLRSSSSKKRASTLAKLLAPVVLEPGHGERHLPLHPLRRPRLLELETRLYLIRVELVVAQGRPELGLREPGVALPEFAVILAHLLVGAHDLPHLKPGAGHRGAARPSYSLDEMNARHPAHPDRLPKKRDCHRRKRRAPHLLLARYLRAHILGQPQPHGLPAHGRVPPLQVVYYVVHEV